MKNIILFQPSIGDFDSLRDKPGLPLGLLYCASIVSEDYKVSIIDQRLTQDWKKAVRECLNEDTVCAGVSSLSGYTIKYGLEFSTYIKNNSDIPVVWGGIHPSIMPEQTVLNEYVDIVVEGEGEITFSELVHAIYTDSDLNNIQGIWYKDSGEVRKTGKRDFIDMDNIPQLPYHLLDLDQYLALYRGYKSVNFQSSRGCNMNCGYCYNTAVNRRQWRTLSAQRTIQDIQDLVNKYPGIESVYFIDDNFFIDLERSRRIMSGMKKMNLTWYSQGADLKTFQKMDDGFLQELQDSNCIKLTLGVESGSTRIRKLMNKYGTAGDIISLTERIRKYDMIFYCDFMVGIPSETVDDIRETIDLLIRMRGLNPNFRNSAFYVYMPYPGTPMYEYIKDSGLSLPGTLEDWIDYDWSGMVRKKKMYNYIHFLSLFIDNKAKDYHVPGIYRILIALYRPVALFRMKKFFFRFMIEIKLFTLLKKLLYSTRSMLKNT
ncbi:B12-binding domain-containing radical SAM protein [Elusimicrobiota bacterium]